MRIVEILYKSVSAPLEPSIKRLWLHFRRTFRRVFFWLPFCCSWLAGCERLLRRSRQPPYNLVFVLDERDEKWILGAICREIAKHSSGKVAFYYGKFYTDRVPFWPPKVKLPDAEAYFFADLCFLVRCLKATPSVWFRRKYLWYTHPQDLAPENELIFSLNQATKVISTCSLFVELLGRKGVKPENLTCVLGAADPNIFRAHKRSSQGVIGFCTAFYPRKNPNFILEVVKALPHRKFILLGRDWERYVGFSKLVDLPNFSYLDVPYSEYPRYYEAMSVFVSVSLLEGGPIPLIEAMMSNIVPVASRTGFAPDIIEHGQNGFLFDVTSPPQLVCEYIEKALLLESDVRATVEHLSWTNFALQINAILAESQIGTNVGQVRAPQYDRGEKAERDETLHNAL